MSFGSYLHVPLPVSSKVQVAPLPSRTWFRPIIRPDRNSAGHFPPAEMSWLWARHWRPFGMMKTLHPGRPEAVLTLKMGPAALAAGGAVISAAKIASHVRRGFLITVKRMVLSRLKWKGAIHAQKF
ncbi:hypothetical protein IVB22_10775 [Bradyrhizobium sp. 190]|uniref:hypothetical protein n=1 Tax=Bradyrhizobium sp. 190 TaxID=2782658 RepID=UPI001FF850EC|nr:hypothetical protein [Bradyrhizobium sp. 190]MCK1513048.1 hypothetical protein [Bradyrhizobium sp. 190]